MEEGISFRSLVKLFLLALVLFIMLAYVVFQARFLIMGPQIAITEEADLLQNKRDVYLTGTTRNISHLWLNDRQIFTNAKGEFKEALILENGYTIATLRAEDRYGRETRVVKQFVYKPASFIK